MKKPSIFELMKSSEQTQLPAGASRGGSGNSKMSLGIVNSEANGRRVSFSKALSTALGLKTTAEIALVPDEGCVLIAAKLPHANVIKAKLSAKGSKEGRKISYSASAVHALTEAFKLNFAEHVSVSYDDVTVEALDDGTKVAVVEIFNKFPYGNEQ